MTGLFAHPEGDGGGSPVVLLHGFGGYSGIWRPVRDALGPDIRTIAYDLPGHGGSIGMREAISPRRAATAILEDLAGRVAGPVHLVGHSMGGAIATLMAVAEPSRIASLTLLAPGGFGENINETALRGFAAARSEAELAEALRPMCAEGHGPDASGLGGLAAVRALPGQIDILEELVGRIAQGGKQGVIPRAMIDPLPMPVTLVWGMEDKVLDAAHGDGLPERFVVRRIAGAGHMLPEECPADVAAIIRRMVAPA